MSDQLLSTDPSAGLPPAAPMPPPAPPPEVQTRMPAGVPARGRGTQVDPEKVQQAAAWTVTPLAHPTGVESVDALTSPVGLAGLAAGGASVARAAAGSAAAGAAELFTQATPYVRYYGVKGILQAAGLPHWAAEAAAVAASGRRGKATEGEAAATVPKPKDMNAPHLDTSVPMRPSQMTPEEMAQRYTYGRPFNTPEAPPMPAPAPPPAAQLPPEFAPTDAPVAAPTPPASVPGGTGPLRQAELAARFGGQGAATPVAPPPSGAPANPPAVMVSPETAQQAAVEYARLIRAGKSPEEARALILQQVELMERLRLRTPTGPETKFPKGMRGKAPED